MNLNARHDIVVYPPDELDGKPIAFCIWCGTSDFATECASPEAQLAAAFRDPTDPS